MNPTRPGESGPLWRLSDSLSNAQIAAVLGVLGIALSVVALVPDLRLGGLVGLSATCVAVVAVALRR